MATRIAVTKDSSGNCDTVTTLQTPNGTDCVDMTGNVRTGTFDAIQSTNLKTPNGTVCINMTGNVRDADFEILETPNAFQVDASEVDQGAAGSGRSLKDIIDSVSTDNATILFRHTASGATTTYTLTTSETVPENVELVFEKGAIVSDGGGTGSLVINGPINAGFYKVFNFTGSGSVSFGDGYVSTVYPEWWGATAKSTSGTAINCTDAIDAALATGKDVKLQNGYYGTTGGHGIVFDGQKFLGSGGRSSDDNGGTVLYKISGTSIVLTVGAFSFTDVGEFVIDCNSLAGSGLKWATSQYPTLHNIYIKGVATPDAAFVSDSANVGYATGLTLVNNYAHMYFSNNQYGTLYSTFNNITLGNVTDTTQHGILIAKGVNLVFNYMTNDYSRIKIDGSSDAVQNVIFNGLHAECGEDQTLPFFTVDGNSQVTSVTINGCKINQVFDDTVEFFNFTACNKISINGLYVDDTATGTKDIIKINGVSQFSLKEFRGYNSAASTMNIVDCHTGRTDDVQITNAITVGGGGATMELFAARASINDTNASISNSGTCTTVDFKNVTGTIDTSGMESVIASNCTSVTDTDDSAIQMYNKRLVVPIQTLPTGATPSVAAGNNFVTQDATTITNLVDGKRGQIVRLLSKHSKTITHNATIVLENEENYDMVFGDVLTLMLCTAGVWYEIGRKQVTTDLLKSVATATINAQTTGSKQAIYTVPAGKTFIPAFLIIHSPSATLVGAVDMDFGGDASAGDYLQQITLNAFTATTDYGIITQPDQAAGPPIVPTKKTVYAAATVFGIYINTGSTNPATFKVSLYGHLY